MGIFIKVIDFKYIMLFYFKGALPKAKMIKFLIGTNLISFYFKIIYM